jgi:hypothetical protein
MFTKIKEFFSNFKRLIKNNFVITQCPYKDECENYDKKSFTCNEDPSDYCGTYRRFNNKE